jgi:hypothetical protein
MKAKMLEVLYNKTVRGLPLLGTPEEVAQRFNQHPEAPDGDSLVALYTGLSGATGFVFGLPGFLLLPFTLPGNIVGVAALQLHMTAALAALGGHDIYSAATRNRCIGCLLKKINEPRKNSEEEEVLSRTGTKLFERTLRFMAEQAAKGAGKLARSVAMRKVGVNRIPLIGGVIGGGSDAYVTVHIGRCAQAEFLTS